MKFPNVTGANLARKKISLPRDFEGTLNVVFVPFEQWQQAEVDSWGAFMERLEKEFSGLSYYELPTIYRLDPLSRLFINEGMRAGIPDPKTRERTITLYLDRADFRRRLNIPDQEHITLLLVDHRGEVLGRIRGAYSAENGEVLLEMVRTAPQAA
jgi:hypothetical protein